MLSLTSTQSSPLLSVTTIECWKSDCPVLILNNLWAMEQFQELPSTRPCPECPLHRISSLAPKTTITPMRQIPLAHPHIPPIKLAALAMMHLTAERRLHPTRNRRIIIGVKTRIRPWGHHRLKATPSPIISLLLVRLVPLSTMPLSPSKTHLKRNPHIIPPPSCDVIHSTRRAHLLLASPPVHLKRTPPSKSTHLHTRACPPSGQRYTNNRPGPHLRNPIIINPSSPARYPRDILQWLQTNRAHIRMPPKRRLPAHINPRDQWRRA